ncbi:uncharacterized protein LOC113321512 [Papaver somniferum]|uniref:uncharacterized protein LOC113321512 n=1 Tax=Papaver somniferum TaxID=3469 RepID=UPI000E70182F|nr:uncharacterized protein LOC113321512 [Papaver somniferum]XP_026425208.1 uncharacterized protein LOC113321512 [Papaver somniferum]
MAGINDTPFSPMASIQPMRELSPEEEEKIIRRNLKLRDILISRKLDLLERAAKAAGRPFKRSFIPCACRTPKSPSNCFNHFNSHVAASMDLYSASAELRETVGCFFVFQDTGEFPRRTNHHVNERLVKGQLAQSESHHLCKLRVLSERNKMPCPRFFFKYLTTRSAPSQFSILGFCIN